MTTQQLADAHKLIATNELVILLAWCDERNILLDDCLARAEEIYGETCGWGGARPEARGLREHAAEGSAARRSAELGQGIGR